MLYTHNDINNNNNTYTNIGRLCHFEYEPVY